MRLCHLHFGFWSGHCPGLSTALLVFYLKLLCPGIFILCVVYYHQTWSEMFSTSLKDTNSIAFIGQISVTSFMPGKFILTFSFRFYCSWTSYALSWTAHTLFISDYLNQRSWIWNFRNDTTEVLLGNWEKASTWYNFRCLEYPSFKEQWSRGKECLFIS